MKTRRSPTEKMKTLNARDEHARRQHNRQHEHEQEQKQEENHVTRGTVMRTVKPRQKISLTIRLNTHHSGWTLFAKQELFQKFAFACTSTELDGDKRTVALHWIPSNITDEHMPRNADQIDEATDTFCFVTYTTQTRDDVEAALAKMFDERLRQMPNTGLSIVIV